MRAGTGKHLPPFFFNFLDFIKEKAYNDREIRIILGKFFPKEGFRWLLFAITIS